MPLPWARQVRRRSDLLILPTLRGPLDTLGERPAGALAAPSLLLSHFLTHYRNLGRTAADGGGGRWAVGVGLVVLLGPVFPLFRIVIDLVFSLSVLAAASTHRPPLLTTDPTWK